jgi:hypothetical protein
LALTTVHDFARTMSASEWDTWWTGRGEPQLTLLLWAVWNPIGTCPPDEYSSYSSRVVEVLREQHEADLPLVATASDDDRVQLQRNALWAEGVERLANLLAQWRSTQMEIPADRSADRHAAETLMDWYEWEMMDTDPTGPK